MQELVEMIIKKLVDKPDEVQISQVEGEKSIIIEVRVSPSDIGKIIGRGGRIANALRTLVKAAATKEGKKVSVDILS